MKNVMCSRSNHLRNLLLISFVILLCGTGFSQSDFRTFNFPNYLERVKNIPNKKNVWIFILAGQSNMAGRGYVEPQDTIPDYRVIAITNNNDWIYAKEPLHFYEPKLAGLDCGLSFGKELIRRVNDSITIALVPCAIGGSSIQQWLGDSLYRGVNLLSNFKARVDFVKNYGIIKGILWHQGESDAHPGLTELYETRLVQLFSVFRMSIGDNNLPILTGYLGGFTNEDNKAYRDAINSDIDDLARKDKNVYLIETKDLMHKGDNLHFNSEAQRTMGMRFAQKFLAIKR